MTRYVLGAVILIAGVLATTQAPVNAALAKRSSSLQAVVVSFAVGTLALFLVTLATGKLAPAQLKGVPWWQLTGGLMGAVVVLSTTVIVPRLGALAATGALVTGQFIGGAVIDRFGLVGMPVVQLTWSRLVGLGLLSLGGFFVLKR